MTGPSPRPLARIAQPFQQFVRTESSGGVVLVLAYGLGMAATLTATGLLLVSLRDRFGPRLARFARFRRFADFTPLGTAALVMLVGVGLATRALAG